MNRRNRILLFIAVAVSLIGVIAYFAISGLNNSPATRATQPVATATAAKTDPGSSRVLVVYFSRTQGIYGGDLEIGHTHRVANYIQAYTGGDQYEIIPSQDYPTDYEETTVVARQELESNARPEIANPLPDVSEYDVVFVGAPIWWGEYPMVVRTFLDGVDLNGKTVIPFTTHEGSGLGNTEQLLTQQYPDASVLSGLAVRGTQSAEAEDEVQAWLKSLGF